MSEVIMQNKKRVEKELQDVASDQNVILSKIEWDSDEPFIHILRVSSSKVPWSEGRALSHEEIAGYHTDNQMSKNVREKLESIIINLKQK